MTRTYTALPLPGSTLDNRKQPTLVWIVYILYIVLVLSMNGVAMNTILVNHVGMDNDSYIFGGTEFHGVKKFNSTFINFLTHYQPSLTKGPTAPPSSDN